jgi:hypothetical protein
MHAEYRSTQAASAAWSACPQVGDEPDEPSDFTGEPSVISALLPGRSRQMSGQSPVRAFVEGVISARTP